MAVAALRTHLDAHQADCAAAGATMLSEPRYHRTMRWSAYLGCWKRSTRRAKAGADGERSFVETVAHDALVMPVYRVGARVHGFRICVARIALVR